MIFDLIEWLWAKATDEDLHRLARTAILAGLLFVAYHIEQKLAVSQTIINQQTDLFKRQDKVEKRMGSWSWYIENVLERTEAKNDPSLSHKSNKR